MGEEITPSFGSFEGIDVNEIRADLDYKKNNFIAARSDYHLANRGGSSREDIHLAQDNYLATRRSFIKAITFASAYYSIWSEPGLKSNFNIPDLENLSLEIKSARKVLTYGDWLGYWLCQVQRYIGMDPIDGNDGLSESHKDKKLRGGSSLEDLAQAEGIEIVYSDANTEKHEM